MRLLLLKLAATLALSICGGCLPQVSVIPQPSPSPQPNARPLELKITIDGEGKINVGGAGKVDVGGDATITTKPSTPSSTLCPCCGATGACRGLCGKVGCICSRGEASAVPSVGNSAALPQFLTQYRDRVVCENGICRTIRQEVRVPIASADKRLAAPSTQGGKIKVYVGGSPACLAMQRDLSGRDGIEFVTGTPPEINGNRWWPTAVKPDGSRWSPARAGWDANSLSQFLQWKESR